MPCKSSILVYGDSGSGKTSLIESLCPWVKKRENKVMRLVTADNYDALQYLIDLGWLVVWDVNNRKYPFESLMFASQGYWPKDMNDPVSELVPPTKETWDKVGAYAFEGLTAFGNFFLNALSDRGAQGDKIGEAAPAKFTDGKTSFAGANMTYYGIAQRRLQDAVDKSKQLPVWLYWTALQMRATDTDTSLPIFGPELVGKAKTGDCPRWFANTLSIAETQTGANTKERRLYLTTYFDAKNPNVPHVCKNRIPAVTAKGVPDYLVLPHPQDAMAKGESWGLGKFLEIVEERLEAAKKVFTSTTTTTKV